MSKQEKVLELIHELRNHLLVAKGLVHFHMTSDRRYTAEAALDEAARKVGGIWSWCLSCAGKEEDDAPNDL